jgi:hypothetical protein
MVEGEKGEKIDGKIEGKTDRRRDRRIEKIERTKRLK